MCIYNGSDGQFLDFISLLRCKHDNVSGFGALRYRVAANYRIIGGAVNNSLRLNDRKRNSRRVSGEWQGGYAAVTMKALPLSD